MITELKFKADPQLTNHASKHVVVLLDTLEIRELRSRDGVDGKAHTKKREGILGLTINDQPTFVAWATDKNGALTPDTKANLQDRVLFLGKRPPRLDLSVELLESDARLARDLRSAATAIGAVSNVVTIVPAAGAFVGGALGFFAQLFQRLSVATKDRRELWLDRTLHFEHAPTPDDAVGLGAVEITRHGENGGVAILLRLKVLPLILPAPADDAPAAATQVFIDEVRIDGQPDKGTLAVELAFGPGGERVYSKRVSLRDEEGGTTLLTGVKGKLVYEGPGNAGIPFRVAAALVPNVTPEQLQEGGGTASEVASAVGEYVINALPKDKQKAIATAALDGLQKVIAGAGQIALDLLDRKATGKVLSIEGLLLPAGALIPEEAATLPGLPTGFEQRVVTVGSAQQGVTVKLRIRRAPST